MSMEVQCPNCLAHHPADYAYICPPFMVALIKHGELKRKTEAMIPKVVPPNHAVIAIADFYDQTKLPEVFLTIPFGHFMPMRGWEMKDCVSMGLPDQYRYKVLRKWVRLERDDVEAWVFYIANS